MRAEPWRGAAKRAADNDFKAAAASIRCDVAALLAVWEVETNGRCYRADGSLQRRHEPHKVPGSTWTWRDSLAASHTVLEQMFRSQYAADPEAALLATSWGGPQTMGYNHRAAGFADVEHMVMRYADSETAQLRGFVSTVKAWNLEGALRAHDWLAFARRYNGSGQPEVYAAKMERAYRRLTGKSSPVVLRVGARGEAVRRLQEALGVAVDGAFGPETLAAVEAFQRAQGLTVDGIVGQKTWAALERERDAKPKPQSARPSFTAWLMDFIAAILGRRRI